MNSKNAKKADDIAEALRQDNIELQTSGRIMAENLEILRGKLSEIHQLANGDWEELSNRDDSTVAKISSLSAPIES